MPILSDRIQAIKLHTGNIPTAILHIPRILHQYQSYFHFKDAKSSVAYDCAKMSITLKSTGGNENLQQSSLSLHRISHNDGDTNDIINSTTGKQYLM